MAVSLDSDVVFFKQHLPFTVPLSFLQNLSTSFEVMREFSQNCGMHACKAPGISWKQLKERIEKLNFNGCLS